MSLDEMYCLGSKTGFTTLQEMQGCNSSCCQANLWSIGSRLCKCLTFHVKFPADEVLHVSHEGSHLAAVVGVVGQVATNELLLGGGLV